MRRPIDFEPLSVIYTPQISVTMQPPSQQDPTPILSGMVQQPSQQIITGTPSTNATAALVLSIWELLEFLLWSGNILLNPWPYSCEWSITNHKSISKSPRCRSGQSCKSLCMGWNWYIHSHDPISCGCWCVVCLGCKPSRGMIQRFNLTTANPL